MSLPGDARERSDVEIRPSDGHAAPDPLEALCAAVRGLPGVDGAAVVVVDGTRRDADGIALVWDAAAFGAAGELQEALLAGPCRQAVDTGAPVAGGSPEEIERAWPGSGAEIVRLGVQSLLVVPLLGRDRCWGTLLLLSRSATASPMQLAPAAQALSGLVVSHLALIADPGLGGPAGDPANSRALHDELTGLPGRELIQELTFHALATAQRRGSPVAVLFVDLDAFAAVNESRGHATGDAVLREVARRLRGAVPGGDSVGRLSGDEFLIVCQDLLASAVDLTAVTSALADRVHAVIAEPIEIGGRAVTVTASVGAAITTDGLSVADLVHEADMAMCEAKAVGCGATVVRTEPNQVDLHRREQKERRLFEALRHDEFEVYYQPIHTSDASLVAVEALLRWNHPTEGVVPAAAFIDIAATTGLIVPLGHWVIRHALGELRRWRDAAPATAPQMVWCNLGPLELVAPDLCDVIVAALTEHRMTPQDLGIEVLENHLDDPRLTESLTRLRASGHPLALDDFGTGYSSLSRLVNLPVSHLKIDRSLVTDLPHDPRSRTLVKAIMTIAADLDVTVISEGIENSAQAEYLAGAGSHLFQGYFYGRPMPAQAVSALLETSAAGPVNRGPVPVPEHRPAAADAPVLPHPPHAEGTSGGDPAPEPALPQGTAPPGGTTHEPGATAPTGETPTRVIEAQLLLRMQELHAARESEAAAIRALQESEARARAVLETAADGIITMSTTGIVQSMNPAAERMFGYSAADVVGRNVAMLMPKADAARHDGHLQRYQRTGERRVIGIGREALGRRADGSTIPLELAVSEVTVSNPFYTGVLRDISQRKELERQLAHQSTHDPLTGLANRTLLMDRLDHAVARLSRHPGFVGVFFIDLDRFKPVNDTHGHAAGDELLIRVARRLRRVVRSEDLVARWGGDEFVVLCEELDKTWEAGVVTQRIKDTIARPVQLRTATICPSASVGFIVDDGTHTPEQLLAMADNAMYEHKSQRRNVGTVASPA